MYASGIDARFFIQILIYGKKKVIFVEIIIFCDEISNIVNIKQIKNLLILARPFLKFFLSVLVLFQNYTIHILMR